MSDTSLSLRDVFGFIARYWTRQPFKLSAFTLLLLAAATIEVFLPYQLAGILSTLRESRASAQVMWSIAIFIGNYFLQISLRWVAVLIYNNFETHLFRDLVQDAFEHLHHLSAQFFASNFAGSLISKITRARARVEIFEDHLFHRMLPTLVISIGSVIFLAMRFPFLGVVLGLYLIAFFSLSLLLAIYAAGPSQLEYSRAQDVMVGRLADCISCIQTTQAFAREESEIREFRFVLEELRHRNHRAYFYGNMIGLSQNIMLVGMLTLLLGGGAWYFLKGLASVEDIAYLTLAYTIIQSYLRDLGAQIKDVLTSSYDLHGLIALMRARPNIQDMKSAADLKVLRGEIKFKGLHFTYPGKTEPIFRSFSLSIRAGEKVALVGYSGSGKTTLLRLLQRQYDLSAGTIEIDGQDIRHFTYRSLRENIALVSQDPILFHRSLRENIAYANPQASIGEIREAARLANVDNFIMGLPEQYETQVGERGVKLSGGERQRIAIAQAILAQRPILILDEATSSLDSVNERAIQGALQSLVKGRTAIMIAHRLSTVLDADRILVFSNGRIIEEGTHSELLARNGLYSELFRLQANEMPHADHIHDRTA